MTTPNAFPLVYDGQAFVINFNGGAGYPAGYVVSFSSSLYICIVDGTTTSPTTTPSAWQVITNASASLSSPAFTGTPTAPTASALTDNTQIATTAYADAAVAVEASARTTADTAKAPLASPALTGTPTAPTKTPLTNSTAIATTAYTDAAIAAFLISAGFEAAIWVQTLDAFQPPAADVAWNNKRITGLAPGIFTTDAANLSQANTGIEDTNNWVFVSATQFTVATNATSWLGKGQRISWKEAGVQKYAVVANSSYSSPTTTVNLIPTVDYAMAANPDGASTLYGNPPGFPNSFGYTPTYTGFSSGPTLPFAWWTVRGGLVTYSFAMFGAGTSNTTGLTVSLPVPPSAVTTGSCVGTDAGTTVAAYFTGVVAATALTILKVGATSTWTASGSKNAIGLTVYPI